MWDREGEEGERGRRQKKANDNKGQEASRSAVCRGARRPFEGVCGCCRRCTRACCEGQARRGGRVWQGGGGEGMRGQADEGGGREGGGENKRRGHRNRGAEHRRRGRGRREAQTTTEKEQHAKRGRRRTRKRTQGEEEGEEGGQGVVSFRGPAQPSPLCTPPLYRR